MVFASCHFSLTLSRLVRSLHDSHNLCLQKQVFVDAHLVINSKDQCTSFILIGTTLWQRGLRRLRNAPAPSKFQVVFLFVCLDIHKIMDQEKILKIEVDPSSYS